MASDDWEIIGLHRSAVPEKNDKGEIVLTKGGVWQGRGDDDFINWVANQGVLMDGILEDVAEQRLPGKIWKKRALLIAGHLG